MNPYTLPLDNMNVIHIPHRFIQPVEENVENDFILFTTRCIVVFGVKHGVEPGSKLGRRMHLYEVRVRPRGLL